MTALSTVAYTKWHEEKPRRRKKRLLHDQPALLWGLGPSSRRSRSSQSPKRNAPLPPDRRRGCSSAAAATRGERLPSLGPNPTRTYLLLRAPSEGVRGCAGPRAATSCGGAGSSGGPARIPPRAASGRRDGGRAPGCPRSSGRGKGNEVNRIPRQEASQGLPSAAALHSCLLSTPEPHLPPPPPQLCLRADTKESSGTSFCCLGTEINKSSLNLQLFPAILSRSCLE